MKERARNKILLGMGAAMVMLLPLLMVAAVWMLADKAAEGPVIAMMVVGVVISLCGWLVIAKVQAGEDYGMAEETEEDERAGTG